MMVFPRKNEGVSPKNDSVLPPNLMVFPPKRYLRPSNLSVCWAAMTLAVEIASATVAGVVTATWSNGDMEGNQQKVNNLVDKGGCSYALVKRKGYDIHICI